MFRRLRIIANGSAVVEDIEQYGRVFQMFSMLLPGQQLFNNAAESWGVTNHVDTFTTPAESDPLPGGSRRQLVVQLLSPFLNQGKWIPLSMLPITVEIELADADEAFVGTGADWEITRPRLLGDVCELDQALQNSYAKHLVDGKSLPMYMHGLYSVIAAIPAGSSLYSLPMARGFTRLSAIYITFWDGTGKWVNRFLCPSLATNVNEEATDLLRWNITIGADRYPSFDCESVQESMYRLRMLQASQGHTGHSISGYNYRNTQFVIGQSLEKCPGMSAHTGINTRSGSQLSLNFRNLGTATTIHVVMQYELILNISGAGSEVLD
jgi:hypothetical protein